MESLYKNNNYSIVPISSVPKEKTILEAVWSHLRKTTLSGEVYRHRSRICANGKRQVHGIDYEETFSPVVSWSTVRILLTLLAFLALQSRQVDYVQAFS